MAGAQGRRGGVALPDRPGKSDSGIISKISSHPLYCISRDIASDATVASKKLLKSTGKAAWIAGTTFLILVVPLIIAMDREQQVTEMEQQQQTLLGAPTAPAAGAGRV